MKRRHDVPGMNIDCRPETRRREPDPEQLDLFGFVGV